jgi:DNA invertase Pin-like site-specific DNA recombinase
MILKEVLNTKIVKIKPISFKAPKRIRVAAYARVSSGKDSMLHSLAAQVSYYSDLIQKRGDWEFVRVYIDEAITGTKDNRAEFNQMIADSKAGKIDMIITKSISRFARNTAALLETVRKLKAFETAVDVYFEREKIHSISSEGEFMLTILASFAQEESRSVSENCKWRIKKRFENGEPVGFTGMFGYDYSAKTHEITVNKEQAKVIKMIFDWYISGDGTMKIAKRLNSIGIFMSNGKKWTDSRILKLIGNEKLTGNSLLQKKFTTDHLTKKQKQNKGEKPQYFVTETHPSIISSEVFEKANQIRKKRAERFKAKDTSQNRYPFSGKIVCENCGKHYKRKKTLKGFSWHCSTFLQNGKQECGAKAIPETVLKNLAEKIGGTENINKIVVTGSNNLIFEPVFGKPIDVVWQDRSRKESWTPEMRETARQRQIKIIKINERRNLINGQNNYRNPGTDQKSIC